MRNVFIVQLNDRYVVNVFSVSGYLWFSSLDMKKYRKLTLCDSLPVCFIVRIAVQYFQEDLFVIIVSETTKIRLEHQQQPLGSIHQINTQ